MTKTRIKNDVYPTEHGIITKVATLMPELFDQATYFEPCAGRGDLVRAIAKHTSPTAKIETADLYSASINDKGCGQTYSYFDARQYEDWEITKQPYDVVITNPPFSDAPAIATQCWSHTKRYLCLILRLSFLEQCKDRREFWQDTQDSLVMIAPINPRPRFRSDTSGSDNMTCAVFVWDKQHSWKTHNLRSPYQMINDWRE